MSTRGPSRAQHWSLALFVLCFSASLVAPIYPREQFLQHAPTVLLIPFLALAIQRQWLSDLAMGCVLAFLVLHVVGARYIYSGVPGGEALTWLALGESAGRNHYDRLVHLAFGVLALPVLEEVSHRYGNLPSRWAGGFAVAVVLALSALYEVFEWLLTIIVAPEYANNYNGQQGDPWDAQKDMLLAGLGALFVLPLCRRHLRASGGAVEPKR